MTGRRRYVVCGLSHRGLEMFAEPLLGHMSGHGELAAVVDVDEARVDRFASMRSVPLPFYRPDEFDVMADVTAPDVVVVTSPDATHIDYVLAALRRDLDVIVEKPMVTTSADAVAVLAAERASRGTVRVGHNLRYVARHRQIKQMIDDGLVGRVTSVELNWSVDTRHGSSYFRRWNRRRASSGGLSVHKGCHHFDLVNWLIDGVPEQVFAYGALNYYGPDSPHRPATPSAAGPYSPRRADTERLELPYAVQYPAGTALDIYDDEIDIEDTYSAVVRYRGGASLAYSVIFSGAWEGYRLTINGTEGRIETATIAFPDRPDLPPDTRTITYYPMFGKPEEWVAGDETGLHGGADTLIRQDLLVAPSEESIRLRIGADAEQAALAVAVGEAVWHSVRDNRPVDVAALLKTSA